MASHTDPALTTEQWRGAVLGWFATFLGTVLAPVVALTGLLFGLGAVGVVPALGVALIALAGAGAVWRNVGRRAGRPRTAVGAIFAAFALGGLAVFGIYWELAVVSPM